MRKPCETCGQRPCVCVAMKKPKHLWIVQYCTRPGCHVAIRSHDGLPEAELICKWHRDGTNKYEKDWPDGMPDPELPWPWMTDRERAIKLTLPFWQERFRRHAKFYSQYVTPSASSSVPVTPPQPAPL
jgi:hypothetical protein